MGERHAKRGHLLVFSGLHALGGHTGGEGRTTKFLPTVHILRNGSQMPFSAPSAKLTDTCHPVAVEYQVVSFHRQPHGGIVAPAILPSNTEYTRKFHSYWLT